MTKITYPTGGTTAFVYEGNDSYAESTTFSTLTEGAGGYAVAKEVKTINFTIPSGAVNFKASWITNESGGTEGGHDPNGNNTTITLSGPNGFSQTFMGNSNGVVDYNITPSIQFMPGSYTLTITNTTSAEFAVGNFSLNWNRYISQTVQKNELAGGLRIKSIINSPVDAFQLMA